jgi:BirA family biotin operon repressor/biotin-[acetyl-CoA-carboxylase] ligase
VTEIALEETTSTNAHALELLRSGAAPHHLTLVWARRQTKGRGRGGRAWQSPEGNVFFSMVLRPQADWGDLSQIPLVTAVATHAAIRPHVPAARAVTLKWPNDVLIDGAKVSGTLIESHRLIRGTDIDRFAAIRAAYLECAHGLGESITVRTSLDLDESISGVFEGINEDGALLLRLGDGTVRQLVVGDVYFGDPRNVKETP